MLKLGVGFHGGPQGVVQNMAERRKIAGSRHAVDLTGDAAE